MNYKVEKQKKEITFYDPEKRFIVMFKHEKLNWVYSLPLEPMYLMTIEKAIECIQRHEIFNNERNFKCEYKIIEFTNI